MLGVHMQRAMLVLLNANVLSYNFGVILVIFSPSSDKTWKFQYNLAFMRSG